jgi:hypothetical protein
MKTTNEVTSIDVDAYIKALRQELPITRIIAYDVLADIIKVLKGIK